MKSKFSSLIFILLFTFSVLFFNLENWPAPWFDEGIFLQTAKNVALSGKYGIQSSEGFRYFDPLITTGPTVILPIAVIFNFFGSNLLLARLVIVIFSTLSVLIYFLITDSIFGLKTAIIASLFLITSTATLEDISGSFIGLSRMVMGEVPAVFFLLLGIYLWFWSINNKKLIPLLISGISFGLAAITKTQHVLTLATFFLVFVVDRFWHRKLRISQLITPFSVSVLCIVIWYIYQLYALDPDSIDRSNLFLRAGSYITIISPQTILRSARVLLSSGILIWGIPALIYGLYLCTERSIVGVKRFFLFCVIVIFLGWFLFGSIGWIRYAFPAIVLLNIFIAYLLVQLADNLNFLGWFLQRDRKQGVEVNEIIKSLAVTSAIVLMVLIPFEIRFVNIMRSENVSPFEFANYIDENISQAEIIESSETEIVFLSNRNFHQPTIDIAVAAINYVQFNETYSSNFYDLSSINPSYLVLGPYAKWTKVYSQYLTNNDYELIKKIGQYELLKLTNSDD